MEQCCHINCTKKADVRIHFHPYKIDDYTESCSEHVTELTEGIHSDFYTIERLDVR